jgi:hypothetical protein
MTKTKTNPKTKTSTTSAKAAKSAKTKAAKPAEKKAKAAERTSDSPEAQPQADDATKPEAPRAKKAKASAEPKVKKLSALDAAAKLLAETGEPMNCKELIDAIAAKGYWTSPGGKTPHATLYSAILREISAKGNDARFAKTERGKFAATR